MKLIMMLIFIFQAIVPATESINKFSDDIDRGYKSYIVVKEESHQYYDLKIIQGINNNRISFGIMLYNVSPNSHSIKVLINNRQYDLPKTNRGDYNLPAIKYNGDIEINIVNDNSSKTIVEIKHLTVDEFSSLSREVIQGEDQGLKFSSFSGSGFSLRNVGALSLIFGGVIIIVSLIIFLFYKRRKGIFSEEKRTENVFNYREYVNDFVSNQNQEIFTNDNYIVPEEEVETEVLESQKAYERQRFYEEEVEDFIDIEKVLKEKGFNTDYQNALEYEKNEIMMELMKMRDLKEISPTQYREETIKLWKK